MWEIALPTPFRIDAPACETGVLSVIAVTSCKRDDAAAAAAEVTD